MSDMSGIFSIIAFIAILVMVVLTNKDKMKQISIWQSIVVIVSFFITIAIAIILIFYGGNWIVDSITNVYIENMVLFIVVVIVIILLTSGLNKLIKKLTRG